MKHNVAGAPMPDFFKTTLFEPPFGESYLVKAYDEPKVLNARST